jgi:preprotein translocase subunit YajC
MIDALQKGDEVVAAGGMLGRISKISDTYVTLEIADKVEIQVQRPAVQLVLPKGTLKNIP